MDITEDELRVIRAEAWDEGYAVAMGAAMSTEAFEDDTNPYRY